MNAIPLLELTPSSSVGIVGITTHVPEIPFVLDENNQPHLIVVQKLVDGMFQCDREILWERVRQYPPAELELAPCDKPWSIVAENFVVALERSEIPSEVRYVKQILAEPLPRWRRLFGPVHVPTWRNLSRFTFVGFQ